jgi:hypothetical protein
MQKSYILIALFFWGIQSVCNSQIITSMEKGPNNHSWTFEQGYLPGAKFPIYPTINPFNFHGLALRVELYDDRNILKINRINCSTVQLYNESELVSPQAIFKVEKYINSIFQQASITIDSTSTDKLEIRLEALDARLLGFVYIKAHGFCQIRVKYKELNKVYCCDIVDGDEHSPLSGNAFVTRKTASRYMASAAIRETIEQFLEDLVTAANNSK